MENLSVAMPAESGCERKSEFAPRLAVNFLLESATEAFRWWFG